VKPPVELAVAIALPIAAVYAVIGGGRLVRWVSETWIPEHRSPQAASEPVERLSANLVRLRSQLEAMETRTDIPAKNLRLRALRAAYVDALTDACRRLDVSPPAGDGRGRPEDVRQAEIYRVEAALRQRGLDVREKAAP
jgi:HAMP domain-containing protein